jgi:hypothetical protein
LHLIAEPEEPDKDECSGKPINWVSASLMPEIAAHIEEAQATGWPRLLTYVLKSGADKSRVRRRAVAECQRQLRKDGLNGILSCDEYPYASTKENDGVSPVSVRPVPVKQQQDQANLLTIFYTSIGYQSGTEFCVEVVP